MCQCTGRGQWCSQAALTSKTGLKTAHVSLGRLYFWSTPPSDCFSSRWWTREEVEEALPRGAAQSSFIPNSKRANNPCGQVAMPTVNRCCRQSPDAGSQFLLAQLVNAPPHTHCRLGFYSMPWGVADLTQVPAPHFRLAGREL